MSPRLTRTYLAVPAHRRRLVESAAASVADAVFLDLEDAVPPEEKGAALLAAVQAIGELDWATKTVAVRLNATGSTTLAEEVVRLGCLPRLDAVIMPKAELAADVVELARRLGEIEQNRKAPVEIELLIETALGVVNVESLAASHPSVVALHFGVGDFAASIGARTMEVGVSPPSYRHVASAAEGHENTTLDLFAYPMMRILIAARAFGLRAIDGPCGSFRDGVATRASAAKAAAMGFDGKQVIHPTQIEATLDAFVPGIDEIAYARRVLSALEEAARAGLGAVTVDGKMIDVANARMIARILRLAGEG